jgi:hypothetical protein
LAEDVADRVMAARTEEEALSVLLGRLRRWQRFLAMARDGLTVIEQRGLVAELYFLATHLVPALGPWKAVQAWKGPSAAHQDFQFEDGSAEVKAATGTQPQCVHVSSERQLDDRGCGRLYLYVLVLDEREVAPPTVDAGISLPRIVTEVRALALCDPAASSLLSDRLSEAGWLDAHSARYQDRRWAVRSEQAFSVVSGFPRILETDLPMGVGNTSYELDLTACKQFAVKVPEMVQFFASALSARGDHVDVGS